MGDPAVPQNADGLFQGSVATVAAPIVNPNLNRKTRIEVTTATVEIKTARGSERSVRVMIVKGTRITRKKSGGVS